MTYTGNLKMHLLDKYTLDGEVYRYKSQKQYQCVGLMNFYR